MKKLLRALTTSGSAVVLAATIASCGSGTVSDPAADASITAKAAPDGISVETAKGVVTLEKPAKRVVSLEWGYTEELVALDVTPVGVADSKGYQTWVSADGAELPEGSTDVGTRQEPSIEQIRALKPDLIVSDEDRLEADFDQLNEIAPVLAFDPTKKPRLQTMKDNFTELGKAVGKQGEAEEVLGELDEKVDDVKAELDEKKKAKYALAQGFTTEGSPGIRMFTSESLAGELIESTGLVNGWDGKPDGWGITTVGVEDLTKIDDDATFLYVAQKDDDPFTGSPAKNRVWHGLEFVKEDRVRALDPGTWVFGGPLSAVQILDETAKAFDD